MTTRGWLLAAALAAGTLAAAGTALSQEGGGDVKDKGGFIGADPREQDPAEVARRTKDAMAVTRFHEKLKFFLGDWTVEMAMGGHVMKGTATTEWIHEGKWIRTDVAVPMMKTHTIMGYDGFKKKYVTTSVNSLSTAMVRMEGNFGMDEKNLFLYGPLDEYMTGEHDKMSGYFLRMIDDDTYRGEIHDLAIGDRGTKVVEFTFRRRN